MWINSYTKIQIESQLLTGLSLSLCVSISLSLWLFAFLILFLRNLSISLLFSWQPNRVLNFGWFYFALDSPSWYYCIHIFYIFTFFPIETPRLGIFYMFIDESNFSLSLKPNLQSLYFLVFQFLNSIVSFLGS